MPTTPIPISGLPYAARPARTTPLIQRPVFHWALSMLLVPLLLAAMVSHSTETRAAALIMLVVTAIAAVVNPYWGLIAFVGLLYVRPEETFPELNGMRLALMVSLTALVSLFFHNLIQRKSFVHSPLNGMILGFGAMAIVSALPVGNAREALIDIPRLVVIVFLILNLVSTPERYRVLVTCLLGFTCYLAAFSIYQYFAGLALQEGDVQRSMATGIFSDPNDLAATIVAGLALALARGRGTKDPIGRVLYFLLAAGLVGAILLTNSRGGMLALLAVIGGFCLVYVRRKWVGVGLAVAMAMLFLALGPSRMTHFEDEESANSRFWFRDNGFDILRAHPLLGVGYDQFPDNNDGMTAHNSFVLCFAELGLPGYFFWMGGLYYGFRKSRQEQEDRISSTLKNDLWGARLALMGFLFACFWLSRTYVPVLYVLMTLPVAAQVASGSGENSARDGKRRRRDWLFIALICGVSIVFIRLVELRFR